MVAVASMPVEKVPVSVSVSEDVDVDLDVDLDVGFCVLLTCTDIELVACRLRFVPDGSGPERKETAEEKSHGTEVNGIVDCGREEWVLALHSEGFLIDVGGCSLTEPPPGGWMLLELESGKSDAAAVGEPVATQGQTLGGTKDEVSLCVPLHGIGTVSTVAVTAGADSVDLGSAALLPLTLPPSATIDCHEPLLSP